MTSGMQEIIDDFCAESFQLFEQLEGLLEQFESDFQNTTLLEQFGQIIDRVMGAAKAIEANDIAQFCELGKLIGYKSGQTKETTLLNVVVAILFDTVDLLKKMLTKFKTGDATPLKGLNTEAFATRLKWLSEKFKHIERASCATNKAEMDQDAIDNLIASLGL